MHKQYIYCTHKHTVHILHTNTQYIYYTHKHSYTAHTNTQYIHILHIQTHSAHCTWNKVQSIQCYFLQKREKEKKTKGSLQTSITGGPVTYFDCWLQDGAPLRTALNAATCLLIAGEDSALDLNHGRKDTLA